MKAKLTNNYLAQGKGTASYTYHLYECTDAEIAAIKKNKGVHYKSDIEEDKDSGQVIEVPRVTLFSKYDCKRVGDYTTTLTVTANGAVVDGDLENFELEAALRNSPEMQKAVGQAQANRYLEKKGLLGGTKRPQLNVAPVVSSSVVNQSENASPDIF
jgi:hypothetical protein